MNVSAFFDQPVFEWVILPLLIFTARILDVSLGTLRIVFLAKGNKSLTPVLGFFEVLIWLLAIRSIFLNLSNIVCYIAYPAGFAAGTYVGVMIEEKMAFGFGLVRIVTPKDPLPLVRLLKSKGFGVTSLNAQGTTGEVSLVFTVVNRRDIPKVVAIIREIHPKAFYSVEDIRSVQEGVFPALERRSLRKIK